jgi:hypothetical protein
MDPLTALAAIKTGVAAGKQLTYQLSSRHEFAMPTAALEGHVIVDYGLQLGRLGISLRI